MPDNNVGRFISNAVGSLPKLPPSAFDKLVNDSLQVRICFNRLLDSFFGHFLVYGDILYFWL